MYGMAEKSLSCRNERGSVQDPVGRGRNGTRENVIAHRIQLSKR